MIPKRAIELAREGLWFPDYYSSWNGSINDEQLLSRIVLDPAFWQALGKQLNWEKSKYAQCTLIKSGYSSKKDVAGRKGFVVGETRDGKGPLVRWEGIKTAYPYYWEDVAIKDRSKNWEMVARKFYDLILTGQSTDEFWKEIIG